MSNTPRPIAGTQYVLLAANQRCTFSLNPLVRVFQYNEEPEPSGDYRIEIIAYIRHVPEEGTPDTLAFHRPVLFFDGLQELPVAGSNECQSAWGLSIQDRNSTPPQRCSSEKEENYNIWLIKAPLLGLGTNGWPVTTYYQGFLLDRQNNKTLLGYQSSGTLTFPLTPRTGVLPYPVYRLGNSDNYIFESDIKVQKILGTLSASVTDIGNPIRRINLPDNPLVHIEKVGDYKYTVYIHAFIPTQNNGQPPLVDVSNMPVPSTVPPSSSPLKNPQGEPQPGGSPTLQARLVAIIFTRPNQEVITQELWGIKFTYSLKSNEGEPKPIISYPLIRVIMRNSDPETTRGTVTTTQTPAGDGS
ncbi:MAG TPA: hypothetical protein DCE41_12990 [Cytophagales bacterium]|nr:hypothetical protein [Cytophagales bacterium]HAA20921.1 hypothetical protein [Cytophagales bacterium]HAP60605.1 hypothetical protein [Cytophagales bacterium]